MKTCIKCSIEKSLGQFRLMQNKYHLNKCKSCYYQEKQDKIKSDPLAKNLKNECDKRYRLKNKDKIYKSQLIWNAANPDKIKASAKRSRINNKANKNAATVARRLAKMDRIPIWITDFDRRKIKYMYQIASMLTKINNEKWTIDHIIPLQGKLVSGLHVPQNLQLMKANQNYSKKNKYEVTV